MDGDVGEYRPPNEISGRRQKTRRNADFHSEDELNLDGVSNNFR